MTDQPDLTSVNQAKGERAEESNKSYRPCTITYFALALDPIHVGTGGLRLGRVDMSIVREPGTNLPKIPGTSLAGACRAYAAMQEDRYRWQADGKTYVCTGQGQENKDQNLAGHCGKPDCPICVTFGFSKGSGASFQGLAQFSDARLVFFPVHSLAGPVWVTCRDALRDAGWKDAQDVKSDYEVRVPKDFKHSGHLNLGWLMLEDLSEWELKPEQFNEKVQATLRKTEMQEILNRAVLVSNKMFGHIVNDNLEVRTSVSINPQTGAAAEGALYTYEALPRASVLYFEVVMSDPKFYRIAVQGAKNGESKTEYHVPLSDEKHPEGDKARVKATVEKGLKLFDSLGIGGMNTRGMGRLKVLNLDGGGASNG